MAKIVKLQNPIQGYAWGSRTAIAEFQGRRAPSPQPEAELWIGDHPTAPSSALLEEGPVPLGDWIASEAGAVLGPAASEYSDASLPFLVKLLAAAAPLSVQVHPNAAQAAAGYAREEALGIPRDAEQRSYRDPRPKQEVLVALEPFRALCGFRDDADARGQVAQSGSPTLQKLLEELPADAPVAPTLFLGLQELTDADRARLCKELAATGKPAASRDEVTFWVARLGECYPGDALVASPLLLHLVVLEPGESLALTPGTVHSYLEGVGMEVMTSSDNVVRAGLTGKHIDGPELRRLLSDEASPPQISRGLPRGEGVREYPTGGAGFWIRVVEVAGTRRLDLGTATPRVIFCLEGTVQLRSPSLDTSVALQRGEAALVPASVAECEGSGDARLFCVSSTPREARGDGR